MWRVKTIVELTHRRPFIQNLCTFLYIYNVCIYDSPCATIYIPGNRSANRSNKLSLRSSVVFWANCFLAQTCFDRYWSHWKFSRSKGKTLVRQVQIHFILSSVNFPFFEISVYNLTYIGVNLLLSFFYTANLFRSHHLILLSLQVVFKVGRC